MNRRMKRILLLGIALVLIFALSLTAFAKTPQVTAGNGDMDRERGAVPQHDQAPDRTQERDQDCTNLLTMASATVSDCLCVCPGCDCTCDGTCDCTCDCTCKDGCDLKQTRTRNRFGRV